MLLQVSAVHAGVGHHHGGLGDFHGGEVVWWRVSWWRGVVSN